LRGKTLKLSDIDTEPSEQQGTVSLVKGNDLGWIYVNDFAPARSVDLDIGATGLRQ